MAKEAHHERVCTFLVAGDKTPASGNEIRAALESSDDEAKVEAMEKAISALLAGEQLPALFITMVRYVLPSENHTVQKLLLLYLETIQKHDAKGTLLPEMILICQNLRNNLQHPNEYVRGVTLRFLTRLQERELLEPLIPSVLSNLDHRHSYVRRYAVLALASIATRPFGEADVPDAPELLEKVLDSEQDAGTRRNAFRALAALSPQRASAFLFARADSAPAWPDSFATEALALLRRLCAHSPEARPRALPLVLSLLHSRSHAVGYEAAVALVALSSAPTAVRAAAGALCRLLQTQSDNAVKLVLLDRLEELRASHADVVRDLLMDVLRALAAPSLEVRRKVLAWATPLLTPRNVDAAVAVLKREAARASAEASRAGGGGEEGVRAYRAALVAALHDAAVRFPGVAPSVLTLLLDFLVEADAAAALDVALFVREVAETNAELHDVVFGRLLDALPRVQAPRVAGALLWMLAAHCASAAEVRAALDAAHQAWGSAPLPLPEDAEEGAEPEGGADPAAPSFSSQRARPAVLPDGSYASQAAPLAAPREAREARSTNAAKAGAALRTMVLGGDAYVGACLAAALTKLLLRARADDLLPEAERNQRAARALALMADLLLAGEATGAAAGAGDADARERVALCVRVLAGAAREAEASARAWLADSRAALAELVSAQRAAAALASRREAAREAAQPDERIAFGLLGARAGGAPREGREEDPLARDVAVAAGAAAGAAEATEGDPRELSRTALARVVQLTGFSDPLYAEAYVTVHQYDIVLDVAITNRTEQVLQNVTLELATLGDLRLVERPAPATLAPGARVDVTTNIKVSSTETGAIFGNLVFERGGTGEADVVVLADVHIDVMDYIAPAACSDAEFRAMWAEFEWENKVAVSTAIDDVRAYVDHVVAATNMRCLAPLAALDGDCDVLAANLYARSVFGEDALVNVSVEKLPDGKLGGFIRIRSKTQGIALSLGDKLILKQKG